MDYPGTLTQLIAPDLALGWQSGTDLTFTMRPISESAQKERTWNGKIVGLGSPEFRLYSYRITSGAGEYRMPALSRMWPDTVFSIVPPLPLGDVIPTGFQSRTLERTPYAPSVRCLTLGFEDVPFTLNGDVVTLSSPAAAPVRIYYQPILEVVVTEPWEATLREQAADVSWSLTCEEVGGTL
ncbi:hypothetical protein OS035_24515 [Rhizobium sp. 268]|uniref:hypothetical protein n=1 Tax=Rhizobium sp. 268 TaxID=2996375 RepID=UPI002F952AA4